MAPKSVVVLSLSGNTPKRKTVRAMPDFHRVATQTIYHDASRPSRIVLPVIPAEYDPN